MSYHLQMAALGSSNNGPFLQYVNLNRKWTRGSFRPFHIIFIISLSLWSFLRFIFISCRENFATWFSVFILPIMQTKALLSNIVLHIWVPGNSLSEIAMIVCVILNNRQV